MGCTLPVVASTLRASTSLLLIDSAVQGAAILLLAALGAALLRRASAARRRFVWLLAFVALLAAPLLSATLPRWQTWPTWVTILPESAAAKPNSANVTTESAHAQFSPRLGPPDAEPPALPEAQPATGAVSVPSTSDSEDVSAPANLSGWNWVDAAPVVWTIGFIVLAVRLAAARWMLWSSERQSTPIGLSRHIDPSRETDDRIASTFSDAKRQLGIRRPVRLLIHPERPIPVVWGVLRCRLMLPVAARKWSREQLQSVLLHELAHVRQNDALAQLAAQLARAWHWFNPLVWFAVRRLHVECERTSDDLVLANNVRPSAYAKYLLE
ncbi:MAG: M56 family metallopeptidase, partial [Planctomycetota bacterium]